MDRLLEELLRNIALQAVPEIRLVILDTPQKVRQWNADNPDYMFRARIGDTVRERVVGRQSDLSDGVLNLSMLTEQELMELGQLAQSWLSAYLQRDFETSDVLRQELMEWGAWPVQGGWHPVFESVDHRQARLAKRQL